MFLIVGGGIVGTALARKLAKVWKDEVVLVEACDRLGEGVSSRSSGVMHAGIYYPNGSIKAAMCAPGREMLEAYCRERAVPHQKTGKWIVAQGPNATEVCRELANRATKNGARVTVASKEEVRERQPMVHCDAAVWSPDTAIVDVPALVDTLAMDAVQDGATILTRTRAIPLPGGSVRLEDVRDKSYSDIRPRHVIACTGLKSVEFSVACSDSGWHPPLPYTAAYCKGTYYRLRSTGTARPTSLVYPMPEPGGLGVHLTLDMDGGARFGPDVQWLHEAVEDYSIDENRAEEYAKRIRVYLPHIRSTDLAPAYTGIRPRIRWSSTHQLVEDFVFSYHPSESTLPPHFPSTTHILGIESPGLTSSLKIADHVVRRFCE